MALLLDTCAILWIAQGAPLSSAARDALAVQPASVSAISAWEIGMLVAGERIKLAMSPSRWFERLTGRPDVSLAALTPDILIASSFLPGAFHRDPADRIICATAREYGLTVVTRDRKILDYAAAGHCRALAC